jgi:NAD-dependent deacetylase
VTVVTQNVDGLHELAGSSRVYAVHGSLYETIYLDGRLRGHLSRAEVGGVVQALQPIRNPSASFEQLQEAIAPLMGLEAIGPYRPRIVMFGDTLAEPDWAQAQKAVANCDCLLSVGTSGVVYPAAMLPDLARRKGATVAAIDPEPVEGYMWLKGKAATLLPMLVAEAFG